MTASLCSLKDPRHGGANTKVVQMMADLRSRVRTPPTRSRCGSI